jgi:hypothetical protein
MKLPVSRRAFWVGLAWLRSANRWAAQEGVSWVRRRRFIPALGRQTGARSLSRNQYSRKVVANGKRHQRTVKSETLPSTFRASACQPERRPIPWPHDSATQSECSDSRASGDQDVERIVGQKINPRFQSMQHRGDSILDRFGLFGGQIGRLSLVYAWTDWRQSARIRMECTPILEDIVTRARYASATSICR